MIKDNHIDFVKNKEYLDFIREIKEGVAGAQRNAVLKVNGELIALYFAIGKKIAEKQKVSSWGDDLIGQMERDLSSAFPDMKGFSRVNLFYMKKLYMLTGSSKNVPQLVEQIPWGHTRLILDKVKDLAEAEFYIQKTIENSWSRSVLDHQIDLKLYTRQGNITNNFDKTVKKQDVSMLKDSFKESYILDFLDIRNGFKERDLEKSLTDNILKFILELGKGFAFVGKQFKLDVGGQEFFIDLLFYNYHLHRFVVIELKNTDFKPEYVGQISFYLAAVNRGVKSKDDKESIGLIICKGKNNETVLEYALENVAKPIGVAEYKIMSELGDGLRAKLSL